MTVGSTFSFSFVTSIFRWLLLVFWAVCGTACGLPASRAGVASDSVVEGPLFHEAKSQFATMTLTQYQHQTKVDRVAGTYRYDCVGFVSYALKQSAPQARESAFRELGILPGRIPSPPKYRAFFASLAQKPQPGWQPVNRVSELRPGDVVAWEQKTKTSSGHAVVVGNVPVMAPDGAWIVEVYDSTSSPHGEDSRPGDPRAQVLESSGRRSGLGRGLMAFVADPATGALTGYRWGPKSKTNLVPIAAGRPTS